MRPRIGRDGPQSRYTWTARSGPWSFAAARAAPMCAMTDEPPDPPSDDRRMTRIYVLVVAVEVVVVTALWSFSRYFG